MTSDELRAFAVDRALSLATLKLSVMGQGVSAEALLADARATEKYFLGEAE